MIIRYLDTWGAGRKALIEEGPREKGSLKPSKSQVIHRVQDQDRSLPLRKGPGNHIKCTYLEVRCTYKLLSNCSYNPSIHPIATVTLDIIGL